MITRIAMLLYPGLTHLDLAAPFEVLSRLPGSVCDLVWKDREALRSDTGLVLLPTKTFAEVTEAEVLFVPGGPGQRALLDDGGALGWCARIGAHAKYVTSVCTGALVLGAAGLLDGYEATTHWAYLELLPLFGARVKPSRVVVDRNRVTAGGVTAGLDFGLRLVAELAGEPFAKALALAIEYDPEPPFPGSGHPRSADAALVDRLFKERYGARVAEQRSAIAAARGRSGA